MGRILIINDAPFWRKLTGDALRQKGHDVAACNGDAALATLENDGADLVLLDLDLPEMRGFAFLEQIRGSAHFKDLPVVLLGGEMHKDEIVRAAKLGVSECLLKTGFSVSDMLRRVQKRLPKKSSIKRNSPNGPNAENETAVDSAKKPTQKAIAAAKGSPQGPAAKSAPAAAESADSKIAVSVPGAKAGPHPASRTDMPASKLMNRDQCIQRAQHAMEARTLSGVVSQVISMATAPRTELSDLANTIARDPILCARVLQAANSVHYSNGRGIVATIPDAVRNIGCAGIREIAATLGVFDVMPTSSADGFNPIRCWQHSFAVASLCNHLAPNKEDGIPYLVGLCHDLGEILFQSHFGAEYRQVIEAQQATGRSRSELEREMLGLTHGDLVQVILESLKLPAAIRQPIAEFHSGTAGKSPNQSVARILQIADQYATGMLLAASEQSTVRPLTRPDCRNATTQNDPPPPDREKLKAEVYTFTAFLGRLSAADEAKLIQPLYPHKPVSVCLVRHPSFSSFDPISAALESMADVTTVDAMPKPDALAAHKGLAVLSPNATADGLSSLDIQQAISRADGTKLPVLWLAGKIEGVTAAPDQPAPLLPPVALSRLAEFIEAL